MRTNLPKTVLFFLLGLLILWLSVGYLLPLVLPFLLGIGLALAAEPAVQALERLKLPRAAASAVSVSGICILSITVLLLILALVARQLQKLSSILPQMETAAQQGLSALQNWLLDLVGRMPGSIGAAASDVVRGLFSDGTSLLGQVAMKLPQIAGTVLSSLSEGLLWLITGIISAYMFSARLPQLKQTLQSKLPQSWQEKRISALRDLRKALGGWLLAELKLAGVALVFLSIGFLLLQVEHAFVWAALVTLVDAFPVLGVGAILVPWSLVCILQGNTVRGIGLLALYGVIWLTRSVLEPRLIGKGLGLDPLVTLFAIYAGWKLWGIAGMLLAPILALTVIQITKQLRA